MSNPEKSNWVSTLATPLGDEMRIDDAMPVLDAARRAVETWWNSETKAAEDLGWSQSTFNRLLRTTQNDLTTSRKQATFLKNIRLLQGDLARWIGKIGVDLHGEFAPGQGDGEKHEPQQITPTETQKGYPYMIGGVGAGSSGRVQHWEGERVYVPQDVVANWTGGQVPAYNEAYWTRVRGTSMEPWLPEETPIFVVRCEAIGADGRYVLYLDDDDAEIVKRVEKLGDGTYLLKPDNPAHGTRKLRRIADGDDDMYDDLTNDMRVRMRVRGRVVYPTDSPQAILRTFAQQMAEVLRQR